MQTKQLNFSTALAKKHGRWVILQDNAESVEGADEKIRVIFA